MIEIALQLLLLIQTAGAPPPMANHAPTAVSLQVEEPVATVFQRLQSSGNIHEATEQLLNRGRSDPKVREYIARHLPPMIEKGPGEKGDHLGPWIEFVRLAEELKIAEAAPGLTKWLTIDNIGEMTTGGFIRLENNPAGKALAEIGDQAVPAVARVFDHGTLRERRYAVYVLNLINSSSATSALQEQSHREPDKALRDYIRKVVGRLLTSWLWHEINLGDYAVYQELTLNRPGTVGKVRIASLI